MNWDLKIAFEKFQSICNMYDIPEKIIKDLFDMVYVLGRSRMLDDAMKKIDWTEFEEGQG